MTTNPWIAHVKAFASKKGISYRDALRHKDVKKGYKTKSGGAPGPSPFTFGKTATPPATDEEEYVDPRFYKKEEKPGFTFGDQKPEKKASPHPNFTFGSTTYTYEKKPSRPPVKGKVPVPPAPTPRSPPAPVIQTMEINSISQFEKFLDEKKDAIAQVLRRDYTKKQFLLKFHPDKCITTSKSVEDLMMKVLGKKVIVNEQPVKICEAIFKKFIRMMT